MLFALFRILCSPIVMLKCVSLCSIIRFIRARRAKVKEKLGKSWHLQGTAKQVELANLELRYKQI